MPPAQPTYSPLNFGSSLHYPPVPHQAIDRGEPGFFLRASPNPACIMRPLITVYGIQGSDSRGSQAG